eukprot:scaffold1317_cov170-Chaetoceros_neogracile.AAC.1
MEQVLELAKNFVAAHVSHNESKRKTVNILGYFFVNRQSISAKEWVVEQAAKLHPGELLQKDANTAELNTPDRTSDLNVLVRALVP